MGWLQRIFARKTTGLGRTARAWWTYPIPTEQQVCYKTKTAALNAFRDVNHKLIDIYGGESMQHTPAEFDAINHRYGLKGKRRVSTIGAALWESLRGGPPWCLENIDLETLNRTSPAVHARPFVLPDAVEAAKHHRKEKPLLRVQEAEHGRVEMDPHLEEALKTGRCFSRKKHRPIVKEQDLSCVCRDPRGRFKSCALGDVPF